MGGKEIICTLGPSSIHEAVIRRLESLGVSLFRMNLSHTKIHEVESVILAIRKITSIPICLDTEGAQIRTGDLKEGRVTLDDMKVIRLANEEIAGDAHAFKLYPSFIVGQLRSGDMLSIDFNSVLIQVITVDKSGVLARVVAGGVIGKNKAVTCDRDIRMPPLTDKDLQAIKIGLKMNIKHVALSFANDGEDVETARAMVGPDTFLISKIETLSGVRNLESIASRSNAVLIDRGDLSRQVCIEQIPRAQKMIIRQAKERGAKVYVATNFLESMVTHSEPTRAEINDIFNTLVDGADGVVLAAETAIGQYPIQSANVAARVIRQYEKFAAGEKFETEGLRDQHSFLFPEPHGGVLVDRMEEFPDHAKIRSYKKITIDAATLSDVEQIAIGSFSPLHGFMTESEFMSVIENFRLPSGVVWPLPVVLPVETHEANEIEIGESVSLCSGRDRHIYATMEVEDIYRPDFKSFFQKVFLTTDEHDPGVKCYNGRGEVFIGGKIRLIQRSDSVNKHFEVTPRQARKIFGNFGWTRVVAFHTRNVAHRVHEYIQLLALNDHYCDGLFIHPLVGLKKAGEFNEDIILRSYEMILQKYYPPKKYFLAAFQSYPRYAGPREAVFTAICRKNFGCSHFIVGCDHSDVSPHYKPDAAHRLFEQLGPLGIQPVFFNEHAYSAKKREYMDVTRHHAVDDILMISGTEMRRMIQSGQHPPEWFMRQEVSRLIMDEIKRGTKVFVE